MEVLEAQVNDFLAKHQVFSSHVVHVKPLKKEITIDQIRSLKKDLIVSTTKLRAVIFHNFDNATLESQNALLKTLEEKSEQNQFIMLAHNSEKIIPTIRSRSKIIPMDATHNASNEIRSTTLELIESIKNSAGYDFLALPSVTSASRDDADLLLQELLIYFRTWDNPNQKVDIQKRILFILNLLQNNNLNPQLAVDNVLIFVKKRFNLNT